jgi:hypothetical protein
MNSVKKPSILFATRAIESPPREGGFVLLTDISKDIQRSGNLTPSFFSCSDDLQAVETEKVFSRPGWGFLIKMQFMYGLYTRSHKYDIVHTAHIPTSFNTALLRFVTRKARRSGTKFVQTITGLPNTDATRDELSKLLWGDYIVCQSDSVMAKIDQTRVDSKLVVPWPSSNRIKYSAKRRAATRKKHFRNKSSVVVFPGEFDRLGVDKSFSECIVHFLSNSKDSLIVLACRFDKLHTGRYLQEKFPGSVVSLGNTGSIVEMLESADLTIYPAQTMNSKFQPPLVITESLTLGTKTLVSEHIGINAKASSLLEKASKGTDWVGFADHMVRALNDKPASRSANNAKYSELVKSYEKVYEHVLRSK